MGRFLTLCTVVADVLGLVASYGFGAWFLPWLGSILPVWLLWLRFFNSRLYQELFELLGRVPLLHTLVSALSQQPGLTWCLLYLGAHLWYIARHCYRRYHEADLARPQPGIPGGRHWEAVQQCYQGYRAALQRFRPEIMLKTPATFRFFTRQPLRKKAWRGVEMLLADTRGEIEWRGRLLIIDQALFNLQRQQDLAAKLAYQLASYNSDDLWYRAFLDCYPEKVSLLHLVSGIGLWLPALVKTLLWPVVYWRRRVLAADRFAFYCGQGEALYQQLSYQARGAERRSFWSPEPLRSERVEQLEGLLGAELAWKAKQA